jgi:dipeptidyl-peptidase 4
MLNSHQIKCMKYTQFLLVLLVFTTTLAQELSVEKIWKKYEYRTQGVDGFNTLQDGDRYTQLDDQGNLVLAFISKPNEAPSVLIDAKSLSYKGKQVIIEDYSFDKSERKVLIMTSITPIYRRSYNAVYFLYDIDTKVLEALSEEHSPQTLAEYSPDGKKVSFIHKNDLYVKDLATKKISPITTDGKRNKVINGTTDWVYEEEFSITKAYSWSPDSKYIAFLKFVEKGVKEFGIDMYGELYPDRFEYKYPKAGEDNSKVSAHWVAVSNAKKINPISLGAYEYIPRIQWSNVSNRLLLQTMNRHQDSLRYHMVDFTAGKKPIHSILFTDYSNTYVDVNEALHFMPNGNGFFFASEKSGYNQLYALDYNGTVKTITTGELDIIDMCGPSQDGSFFYYTRSSQGGISKVLCRINLSTSSIDELSPAEGWMEASFTQGMKYYIGSYSNGNTPPVFVLYKGDGSVVKSMEDNAALNKVLSSLNLSKKTYRTIKVNSTELNVSIIYPPNFNESNKYPVYMNVYGGPGHNEVTNQWDGNDFMFHQLLASKGYIVVSVDPRGTQYRGAAFKKATYLQLGKLEVEDFIGTAKYFQTLSYVDANRVGIMGWSYGGFMSSLAMTKGADVFSMGIAVAPVTNWRYYDNIYTERFMRTPQENPSGYDTNSPINHVDKLKGKFLLVHGMADDNVHFQNSTDMITALVKANKQFDFFAYPNKNHGIYGGNTRNHLFSMMYDYILTNL